MLQQVVRSDRVQVDLDRFLEVHKSLSVTVLLVFRPGGGVEAFQFVGRFAQPGNDVFGCLRRLCLPGSACRLLGELGFVSVPGRNHAADLLLAGDFDEGSAGGGAGAAAFVPNLLG